MKTINKFAELHNLTVKEITYSSHGIKCRRLGYDLKNNNVLIRIEPKQFPVTSIYAKDKYMCVVEVVNPNDYFIIYGSIFQCIAQINKLNIKY